MPADLSLVSFPVRRLNLTGTAIAERISAWPGRYRGGVLAFGFGTFPETGPPGSVVDPGPAPD